MLRYRIVALLSTLALWVWLIGCGNNQPVITPVPLEWPATATLTVTPAYSKEVATPQVLKDGCQKPSEDDWLYVNQGGIVIPDLENLPLYVSGEVLNISDLATYRVNSGHLQARRLVVPYSKGTSYIVLFLIYNCGNDAMWVRYEIEIYPVERPTDGPTPTATPQSA